MIFWSKYDSIMTIGCINNNPQFHTKYEQCISEQNVSITWSNQIKDMTLINEMGNSKII